LLTGLCKIYSIDFYKIQWQGGTRANPAKKETTRFCGNPDLHQEQEFFKGILPTRNGSRHWFDNIPKFAGYRISD